MDTIEGFLEEDLRQLLTSTIRTHVENEATVTNIKATPLQPGPHSRERLFLCKTAFVNKQGAPAAVSLVVKESHRVERRTMNYLAEQAQPNVPFIYCPDLATDNTVWTCIQYVGDVHRPTSLEPITTEEIVAEAEALASIHSANLGKRDLSWLRPLEPGFFEEELGSRWRPNWERVLRNDDFVREFSADFARIERAAERMPAEMSAMAQEENCLTIAHADITPRNVLIYQGRPYYIDWEGARYAPFYIDLPHHHCTLEQAETYRKAMAMRGVHITRDDFVDRYRAAAKYIAFRYMWWVLEHWENDHSETAWVRHYFGLIGG